MNKIFEIINNEETGITLSKEAMDVLQSANQAERYVDDQDKMLSAVTSGLCSSISMESALATIDNAISKNEITATILVSGLLTFSTEANKLFGTSHTLDSCVDDIIKLADSDMVLAVEAYEKKRRTLMESILNSITDGFSILLSADYWKDSFSSNGAFANEKRRLAKLESIQSELKHGKRVIKSELTMSDAIKRKLGVYSARYNALSFKDLEEFLSEYYSLYESGLMDSAISDVHDSLVQSISNEVDIPKHKDSLDFIEKLSKLDLSDVLFKDSRVGIVGRITGTTLNALMLVQDNKAGLDYNNITKKIDKDLYTTMSVGDVSGKSLIKLISLVLSETKNMREYVDPKQNKALIKDFVKNLRSGMATAVYSAVFEVFALRRVLRQVFLASRYIDTLFIYRILLYKEWTNVCDLVIMLAEELTELRE